MSWHPPTCIKIAECDYREYQVEVRGYVYVMTNKSHSGLVKIGFSLKEPKLRAAELSTTGVPHPFEVVYDVCVFNPKEVEQAVHRRFRREGCHESKEFFKTSVAEAVAKIKQVLVAQKKTVLMENSGPQQGGLAAELVKPRSEVTWTEANYCPKCKIAFEGRTKCMYCRTALVAREIKAKRTCPQCGATYEKGTQCMYCKVKLVKR